MNREDIIRMVQEVIFEHSNVNPFDFAIKSIDQLECFADLVAKHEREACAQMCEELVAHTDQNKERDGWLAAVACTLAIRARGEK
jgi:hypothetical protein